MLFYKKNTPVTLQNMFSSVDKIPMILLCFFKKSLQQWWNFNEKHITRSDVLY